MPVCISQKLDVQSTKFSMLVTYGRGTVLLYQHCNMLQFYILWMTFSLHILARHRLGKKAYAQTGSPWGSMDSIQSWILHILIRGSTGAMSDICDCLVCD